MLKIGIVGGRLQGLEAVYLAKEADFEVALIDRNPMVPAKALVEEFHEVDLLAAGRQAESLLTNFDLILPATENIETLTWLEEKAYRYGVPLALDLAAYRISSSKIKSNELFARHGIPMPEPWPRCGFPVIIKPSGLSGSMGVEKAGCHTEFNSIIKRIGGEAVIQKYISGPSYSLEVIADKGVSTGLQVTELNFDAGYDCKRVLAGPGVGSGVSGKLNDIGERLAEAINLSGIMDIEVIEAEGELKVLEIDARLPSQTPSAVYHSSGLNMVEMLANYWTSGRLPSFKRFCGPGRAVVYEHIRFDQGLLEVAGEHILSEAQGLAVYKDTFQADVLISNYEYSPANWVATLIVTADSEGEAWERRSRVVESITRSFKVDRYLDPVPVDEGRGWS